MTDIFIAIIVALILLIVGYVFQTKTEIKNENNKNIVKSRLEWLKNLKENFSSYNEILNDTLKLKNPHKNEFKDLFIKLENNVNKIQQEFKPYSYVERNNVFKLIDKGEESKLKDEDNPDFQSYLKERKCSAIEKHKREKSKEQRDEKSEEDKNEELETQTKILVEYFTTRNNFLVTDNNMEIDLELFLILLLDEVNIKIKPYTDHHNSNDDQEKKKEDYNKFLIQLELYKELILEVQKLIIKIEWERIKKDSDSGYKEKNLNELIAGNINDITDKFANNAIRNMKKQEASTVIKTSNAEDSLIEIKKDSVLGILAETINEIYNKNKKIDFMPTSTGQRYIYTTVEDASHPNGKLFGNKKELPLPLVIDGDALMIDKANSKETVYVETNFNKQYAENLSELMKQKAGLIHNGVKE